LAETDREMVLRHALTARFTPDGRYVFVHTQMEKTTVVPAPGEPPQAVPFTPARLFDSKGSERAGYKADTFQVSQALLSPDGRFVLTVEERSVSYRNFDATGGGNTGGSGGGSEGVEVARLFDAATGRELAVLRDPPYEVPENPATEEGRKSLVRREISITGAAFSPDGRRVVTVGNVYGRGGSGTTNWALRIWDVPGGRVVRTVGTHDDNLGESIHWSPDGRHFLTHYQGRRALLWDAETGTRIELDVSFCADLNSYSASDRVVFTENPFSPDGTRLAGVGAGRTLQILDARTGKLLAAGKGHRRGIRCVAFSADSRRVVTAADDETARVWDAATGEELFTLTGHKGPVLYAVFSPDSGRVATVGADGTGRVWGLDLLGLARTRKPRELTPEERERFEIDKAADR
jgi:WD40 repeat protein